jgi:hypothetical protein
MALDAGSNGRKKQRRDDEARPNEHIIDSFSQVFAPPADAEEQGRDRCK